MGGIRTLRGIVGRMGLCISMCTGFFYGCFFLFADNAL